MGRRKWRAKKLEKKKKKLGQDASSTTTTVNSTASVSTRGNDLKNTRNGFYHEELGKNSIENVRKACKLLFLNLNETPKFNLHLKSCSEQNAL